MIPVFVVNVNAFFPANLRKTAAESVDFDQKNRRLYVEYSANTDYGLITRKEVLGYGDH